MKRNNIRFLFCFMAILLWQISCTVLSFAADNISVKVDAGFDGNVKINFSNQFKFSLTSNENFSGQLVMTLPGINMEKLEYAINVELPAGVKKEYVMNVPVYTIDKKFAYKILQGKKEVITGNFEIKKVSSPEAVTMGVLCEDKNAFSEYSVVNSVYFSSNARQMNMMHMGRMKFGYGGGMLSSQAVSPYYGQPTAISPNQVLDNIEISKLDGSNFPDNFDSLEPLNMIIIDNFDTSKLNKAQLKALKEWVSSGKILIICNGAQYKKVNSGLPEELKFFKILEIKGMPFSQSMKKFGDFNNAQMLNIAIGEYSSSQAILKDGEIPLITIHSFQDGQIVNTAFSMYESPYNSWNGRIELFKFIIQKLSDLKNTNANYLATGQEQINMLSQSAMSIPDDRLLPITTILIILSVYLMIVSPILYFILKKKDKRELSWVFVPLISILFVGIIYVAGYKTKFTKAVTNNVSLIELSQEKKTEKITSLINIFNNKNGTLKIQYPKDFPLEVSSNMMPGYGYEMRNIPNQVTSRLTFGDEISYELYYANLWRPKMVCTTKEQKSEGSILMKCSLKDKDVTFKLKNESPYPFKDTYILFGSNIYNAGEIKSGEDKQISGLFTTTFQDPVRFMEDKFRAATLSKLNDNKLIREANRKRNLLQGIFMNIININNNPYGGSPKSPITVVALNDTPIKYPIKANDDTTDAYTTNIIIQNFKLEFEKGDNVFLPSGLIKPTITGDGITGFLVEPISNVRFQTDGTVNLGYELPQNLKLQKVVLNLDKLKMTMGMKEEKNAYTSEGMAVNSDDNIEVKIQNFKTGNWEKLSDTVSITKNPGDYVNSNMLNLKISVSKVAQYQGQLLISCPEIEISGVKE